MQMFQLTLQMMCRMPSAMMREKLASTKLSMHHFILQKLPQFWTSWALGFGGGPRPGVPSSKQVSNHGEEEFFSLATPHSSVQSFGGPGTGFAASMQKSASP